MEEEFSTPDELVALVEDHFAPKRGVSSQAKAQIRKMAKSHLSSQRRPEPMPSSTSSTTAEDTSPTDDVQPVPALPSQLVKAYDGQMLGPEEAFRMKARLARHFGLKFKGHPPHGANHSSSHTPAEVAHDFMDGVDSRNTKRAGIIEELERVGWW